MFSFCIKKTFFDMWDNFLAIFLMNIGLIVLICIILLIPLLVQFPIGLLYIYLIAGFLLLNLYIGAVFRYTLDISDNKKDGGFFVFFRYLMQTWKQSIVSAVITLLLMTIFWYIILYYFISFIQNGSIIDLIFGGIVLTVWLNSFLLSLYFFPASFRINKKIIKSLQACYILLFQNIRFTCAMLAVAVILVPVSFFLFFMLPGPAAIMLWINVCVKIRLYKHEYLETHPGADKKNIPWEELLLHDEEKIGKRTIRGLIFPWKQ
jgi:hypothetical protein